MLIGRLIIQHLKEKNIEKLAFIFEHTQHGAVIIITLKVVNRIGFAKYFKIKLNTCLADNMIMKLNVFAVS